MTHRHVLLIDDESAIREVTALSLQTVGGWRVSRASSGAAGVAMACADPPDAILLDVMMPELDGPATLRRLRADLRTRSIPVIFLTARAHSADRRAFATLGAAGTLTKPFDPMTLTEQITTILDGSDDSS